MSSARLGLRQADVRASMISAQDDSENSHSHLHRPSTVRNTPWMPELIAPPTKLTFRRFRESTLQRTSRRQFNRPLIILISLVPNLASVPAYEFVE